MKVELIIILIITAFWLGYLIAVIAQVNRAFKQGYRTGWEHGRTYINVTANGTNEQVQEVKRKR